jgi:hypothetical protein
MAAAVSAATSASRHRDVHAERHGLPGQLGPQPGRLGAGHLELQAGDRPMGEPPDPVDVRAAGRDPAGDRGDDRGRQRAAEHGDVQPAAAAGRLGGAQGDLGIHPEVRRQAGYLPVNGREVGSVVAVQQDAQHQPPADDHLLDVQDAEMVRRQAGKKA